MVFSCAVFSDVPGSRKSSENMAEIGVFRQKDCPRHTGLSVSSAVPYDLRPVAT
jgi:hypothetical protein